MPTQVTTTADGTITTTTGPSGDGLGTSRTVQFTPTPGGVLDNATTLRQRAQTALTNNQTFLAIASPTNAQAVAQIQANTRQINGVIRLMQGLLDQITDS